MLAYHDEDGLGQGQTHQIQGVRKKQLLVEAVIQGEVNAAVALRSGGGHKSLHTLPRLKEDTITAQHGADRPEILVHKELWRGETAGLKFGALLFGKGFKISAYHKAACFKGCLAASARRELLN